MFRQPRVRQLEHRAGAIEAVELAAVLVQPVDARQSRRGIHTVEPTERVAALRGERPPSLAELLGRENPDGVRLGDDAFHHDAAEPSGVGGVSDQARDRDSGSAGRSHHGDLALELLAPLLTRRVESQDELDRLPTSGASRERPDLARGSSGQPRQVVDLTTDDRGERFCCGPGHDSTD
jgi:hypothetical protein